MFEFKVMEFTELHNLQDGLEKRAADRWDVAFFNVIQAASGRVYTVVFRRPKPVVAATMDVR